MYHRNAFTLIELLVVIAIIAILSLVVILVLNPGQLLQQSRDANRLSDLSITNTALGVFAAQGGISLGASSVVYISVPDPSATSSAGDQCQGLNLPAAPTGTTYLCGASSTYRNTTGSGWIPVNFSSLSGGSPLGQLPLDPTNQTSSGLYYTYATNGTQYEITAIPESQKYKAQSEATPEVIDYPGVLASGNNLAISPLWSTQGLIGYWPFEEGSGSSTADVSGNGNAGIWSGGSSNGTYYTGGKVASFAGNFNGNNTSVSVANQSYFAQVPMSVAFWFYANQTPVAYGAQMDLAYKEKSTSPFRSWDVNLSQGAFPNQIDFETCPNTSGSCPYQEVSNAAISAGTWYDVVVTMDVSFVMRMYVNGVAQTDITTASGLVTSDDPLSLGSYFGGTGMDGAIDDFRIYNRVLSPAEATALYNSTR